MHYPESPKVAAWGPAGSLPAGPQFKSRWGKNIYNLTLPLSILILAIFGGPKWLVSSWSDIKMEEVVFVCQGFIP